MRSISVGDAVDGLVVGHRLKAAGASRIALVGVQQPVGVRALQVALHALGTEHAAG